MNNPFLKYTEESMSKVRIGATHKKELAKRIFGAEPERKKFRLLNAFFFTAPAMAMVVLILFFTLNKNITQQALLPQQALAQALENTFDLESLSLTFGLPNDGKFHHRSIESKSLKDPNVSGPEYFTKKTDLWTDGTSVRKDIYSGEGPTTVFSSTLANEQYDDWCEIKKLSKPECTSLKQIQKEDEKNIISNHGRLYPVDQEEWVSDIEAKTLVGKDGSLEILLSWSTSTPMRGIIWHGNSPMTINRGESLSRLRGGEIDYNYYDEFNYYNQMKNNRYWHKNVISNIEPAFDSDDIYFQIQNIDPTLEKAYYQALNTGKEAEDIQFVTHSSMVYKFSLSTQAISALSPKEIVSQIRSYKVSEAVLEESLKIILQPIIYVMKNPHHFNEPKRIETIQADGRGITKLTYDLPMNYFHQTGFAYPRVEEIGGHSINLFMDEVEGAFLGYSIWREGKELDSAWIEDEILPDSEKETLFSKEIWLDLAEEKYNSGPNKGSDF